MGIKFYTAGKIWHADKFRTLRDDHGMAVHARWIDLKQDSELVQSRKDLLWQMCYEDVRDSDFVLLYSEDESEEQRGALVEIGMAYGMNKPVYAVGKCKSIMPNNISDVAFTHHHLWKWLDAKNLLQGSFLALAHELKKRPVARLAANMRA